MWRNSLPKEIRSLLEKYDRVTLQEVNPYRIIITVESLKYLVKLPHKNLIDVTLRDVNTYLASLGINDELLSELDSYRRLRNKVTHDLTMVSESIDYLFLYDEYLSGYESLMEDLVRELNKPVNTGKGLQKTNIFSTT